MHKNQKHRATLAARILSLVLVLLVLNLCIQVPASTRLVYKYDAYGNVQIEKKANKKFILEMAADYLTDTEESRIPDNASSNLLEELNEVKEDWCYHTQAAIQFKNFCSSKMLGIDTYPLLRFLQDSRLSPPPEQV